MQGIYIHVPFCVQKCVYCDFYSIANPSHIESYVKALVEEIIAVGKRFPNSNIDTLYIGGGTPSLLPFDALSAVMDAVNNSFQCSFKEVTLEINPCTGQDVARYNKLGINRLSFGVQSLKDDILKTLGRRHSVADALAVLALAKDCGYRVSADLMLGVPGETDADISEFISRLSPLVEHISAYILKVEPNTTLSRLESDGVLIMPDDDSVADTYDFAVKELRKYGFERYEISNFAKLGAESLHNLKYWKLGEYFGFGPSAHGFICGRRYYNVSSVEDYCRGVNSGNSLEVAEESSSITMAEEAIMLGLRMTKGINLADYKTEFGVDILDKYAARLKLIKDYLTVSDGYLRLNDNAFLLENRILTTLFY